MVSRRPGPVTPSFATAPYRLVLTNGVTHRSVVVGPWLIALSLFLVGGIAAWCVGLTSYIYFKDDVMRAMTKNHAATIEQYEDDMASLRLSVDRIRGRQFVNQGSFDAVLKQLQVKQEEIQDYQSRIMSLVDRTKSAGLKVKPEERADTSIVTGSTTVTAGLPSNNDHAVTLLGETVAGGIPVSRPALPARETIHLGQFETGPDARMVRQIEKQLFAVADGHSALLNAYEEAAKNEVSRLKGVFSRVGLPASRFGLPKNSGIGGPFIPSSDMAGMSSLDLQIARIERYLNQAEAVEATVAKLPIQRPVSSSMRTSSRFGPRIDPFFRKRAFHSGLDFATPRGTPVKATAKGRVARAGWAGGYGRMVEIDHGNGIKTRYAHLNRISVKVGQRVEAGKIIGRSGNTGRSTGPHLHYETRIDGKPVDPMRFLTAL